MRYNYLYIYKEELKTFVHELLACTQTNRHETSTGTTLGVSLLNHSSILRARVRHVNARCPPAVAEQAMNCDTLAIAVKQ